MQSVDMASKMFNPNFVNLCPGILFAPIFGSSSTICLIPYIMNSLNVNQTTINEIQ